MKRMEKIEKDEVAVGSDWTELGQYYDEAGLYGVLVLEHSNTGATNAITDFRIQLKDHANGSWYTFLSGSDFDTASGNLLFSTTEGLHEVAAGSQGHAHIRLNGFVVIKFDAKSAAGTTSRIRGTIVYSATRI